MKIYVLNKKMLLKILLGTGVLIVAAIVLLFPSVRGVFGPKRILPIYNVQMEEKKVALSFDAAWGADDTQDLINALKAYDARATFFLVGQWAEKYPAETKAISDAGHEIGNHSYKHPDMTKISEEKMREEILKANEAIKKVTGKEVTLYRPPYGAYNNTTMQVLDSLNMHTIQWDVDSLDWKDLTADQIVKKVVPKVKPGSIVLFHNNAKHTAHALPLVLKELKNQGYEFVSISEIIIKDKGKYYIDHKGTQIRKDSVEEEQNEPTMEKINEKIEDKIDDKIEHNEEETLNQKGEEINTNSNENEETEDVIHIIDTTI